MMHYAIRFTTLYKGENPVCHTWNDGNLFKSHCKAIKHAIRCANMWLENDNEATSYEIITYHEAK